MRHSSRLCCSCICIDNFFTGEELAAEMSRLDNECNKKAMENKMNGRPQFVFLAHFSPPDGQKAADIYCDWAPEAGRLQFKFTPLLPLPPGKSSPPVPQPPGHNPPQLFSPHSPGAFLEGFRATLFNAVAGIFTPFRRKSSRTDSGHGVYQVVAVAEPGEIDGANNEGALLVRTLRKPTAASESYRSLFCKKMSLQREEINASECAAAKIFVDNWRKNGEDTGQYVGEAYNVATPFCTRLRPAVDSGKHEALCADAMNAVTSSSLLAEFESTTDAASSGEASHNALWWTWESNRVLKEVGFFHRDITDENWLRSSPPAAFLIATDMGVACATSQKSEGNVVPCQKWTFVGTPVFVSPDHLIFPFGSDYSDCKDFGNKVYSPKHSIAVHAARGDSFSWAATVIQAAAPKYFSNIVLDLLGLKRLTRFELLLLGGRRAYELIGLRMLLGEAACPSSILMEISTAASRIAAPGASSPTISPAGETLKKFIKNAMQQSIAATGSGEEKADSLGETDEQKKIRAEANSNILRALEATELKPLPYGGSEKGPIPAIELMAQILLGNPWNLDQHSYKSLLYTWTSAEDSDDAEVKAAAVKLCAPPPPPSEEPPHVPLPTSVPLPSFPKKPQP
ncbi:unnamed protein product [Amoebophrya sp. A25]|nr:unnamed protein product [Amoebophrya sp. A25]|eukprot:GSA25T00027538001.1